MSITNNAHGLNLLLLWMLIYDSTQNKTNNIRDRVVVTGDLRIHYRGGHANLI